MWIDMIPFLIGIVLFFVLSAAVYLFVLVRPRGKAIDRALLCDYAHRGLHGEGVPENSLAAFARAVEAGYGIELDVQLSRDGTVMVFHDATLTRMTDCDKKVNELNVNELQALSLAGTEQTVPTFVEVLTLVGGKVPLLVELKGETTDVSLCKKVASLLSDYDGAYCIESFNPLLVHGMKKYLPDACYGQLYTNVCRDKNKTTLLHALLTSMALNVLSRPDFIAYNKQDRDALPVKLTTRLFGASRFVWTVRGREEQKNAHIQGECAIFEDVIKD